MKWHAHIKIEQLPEDYQLVARIIGLDATIRLAYGLPSVHLYLKSPDRLFQAAKDAFILECHANAGPLTPFNARDVALQAQTSESYVYRLIGDQMEKNKQGDLFADGEGWGERE